MKTWPLLNLEPNSNYQASVFRIETLGASYDSSPSTIHLDIEFYTDEHSIPCGIKDHPMVFGGLTELLEGFEVLWLKNLANDSEIDFRYFAAAVCNSTDLASEAESNDADPNLRAKQSTSALHIAAMNGYFDVVEMLLEDGAEVDAADDLGWTPLFIALQREQNEIAKYLHAMGASTTATIDGKEVSVTV